MLNFNFQNPTHIYFGEGQIKAVSKEVPINARVLVVYGGGSIKSNGVYQQVIDTLKDHTWFEFSGIEPSPTYDTLMKSQDIIKKESIDFVLMHPPYADIIKYSDWKIKEDLSNIHDIDKFCDEIEKVAKESFRILKPWKYCAVLMWDTRREKMYQPMAFKVMERFLKTWFALKEDIIKVQHNCKATWFWVQKSKDFNFLLIMHEHLFIFKKLK